MEKRRAAAAALLVAIWYSFLLRAETTTASPSPACAGSAAPVMLGQPLGFCGFTGISCCDAVADAVLREQFDDMNVSDEACAAMVKASLCARCIPSLSAALFDNTATTSTKPSRMFLSSRDGKIWLASMPRRGSGGALRVDDGHVFLDLHHDALLGLVGVAFHPEFAANGRFFVSYHCDSSASPACAAGRCWGAAPGNGSRPCRYQYQLVVAEFSAKGGPDYAKATRADPSEVRRIFTMGLPQPHATYSYQNHGGQILFRPRGGDGYLYVVTGHGDFKEDKRSFLGKIIRFNVDGAPGESGRGTWNSSKPEIFSIGLNNPCGCSFDPERPSLLYCADMDEQQYKRVYLIFTGGNYGGGSLSKAAVSVVPDHGRAADSRMPFIVGGVVYQGPVDPSLKGRYLYMYASGLWAVAVSTGRYATTAWIPNVRCSWSSPVPCHGGGGGIHGHVLSISADSRADAFILATGGVYRVVTPGLCCAPPPPLTQWPAGTGWVLSFMLFALAFAMYQVWSTILRGGGTCSCFNGWFSSNVTNNNYRRREHEG